ncbi:MAG: flavodoxin family protein [Deltaproteobacteria bacterium]|uniref:flavodoxin family protein n=1 Tax=Desulfobacula sp. TaxID=2593537 RepID=UPI0019ABC7F6|nr:flavodoxin family protein [Candidatus Desulfobacula maris]MBL6992697.1 flavodoxin family protein [Desulfobacula sp.]
MKVTILQGSARKKGNTARVLTWVEEELIGLGHEVDSIYLHSKNLKGCLGCAKCKEKPDTIGCVQKDDVREILEKMIDSQLIIFSSPLYFWGFSAQIKAVIDRTYSLYTNYNLPDHASLIDGRRQALIATGAGPYDDNAEGMVAAFGRMQKYHKAINVGELFIDSCSTPDALGDSVQQKAIEFARKIVA